MPGKYKPAAQKLRRNPEILTLVNPSTPKAKPRKSRSKAVVVPRAKVPRRVASGTKRLRRNQDAPVQAAPVSAPVSVTAPKPKGEEAVKKNPRRKRALYKDPHTNLFISASEAARRGISPLKANSGAKANPEYRRGVPPAQPRKRKVRKSALRTPKQRQAEIKRIETIARRKEAARARKQQEKRKASLAALTPEQLKARRRRQAAKRKREKAIAALQPYGTDIPLRPKKKARKGSYAPGVQRSPGQTEYKGRVPGWYGRPAVPAKWVYYKNPRRRKATRRTRDRYGRFVGGRRSAKRAAPTRRSYRRNPDWKKAIIQTLAGGGGFFASRALANLAIDHQDKIPTALQPYVGHLTNAALFAAAVLVPPKVKQLKDLHVPLVIGTGIALVERLLTSYAPESIVGRVAPPVAPIALSAGDAELSGMDIYETALSGLGFAPEEPSLVDALMDEAGVGDYVDTSIGDYVDTSALEGYVDTSMGDYVDTSALEGYVDTEALGQDYETIGNYVDTSAMSGYGPSQVAEELGEEFYSEALDGYLDPEPLTGYGPSPVAEELGFDVYDTSLSGGIFGESGSPVTSGTYPAGSALEALGSDLEPATSAQGVARRAQQVGQLRGIRDRLLAAGVPEATVKAALENTVKKMTTPRAGGPAARSYSSSGAESFKVPIPMAVKAPHRPMGRTFAGNVGGIFKNGIFS